MQTVSELIDIRLRRDLNAATPCFGTAERMEELLAQLAREASAEATPQDAERYACAVMFIETGLRSMRRLRNGSK